VRRDARMDGNAIHEVGDCDEPLGGGEVVRHSAKSIGSHPERAACVAIYRAAVYARNLGS
jgi:hypothetical protein